MTYKIDKANELHITATKKLKNTKNVYSLLDVHAMMNDLGKKYECFGTLDTNAHPSSETWENSKAFVEYCKCIEEMLSHGTPFSVYIANMRMMEIKMQLKKVEDALFDAIQRDARYNKLEYIGSHFLATDGKNNYFFFRVFGEKQWYYIISSKKIIVEKNNKLTSNYGGQYYDLVTLSYL